MNKSALLRRVVILGLLAGLVTLHLLGQNAFTVKQLSGDGSSPLHLPARSPNVYALSLEEGGDRVSPLAGRQEPFSLNVNDSRGAVKQFEETSYYLNDVDFVTADSGWATGQPYWDQDKKQYRGTIIKTMNGGEEWVAQETTVTETFRAIDFIDANNGWVVGANGTILSTNNGGAQWGRQTVASNDDFLSVAFHDDNTGWATSIETVHFDSQGRADNWEAAVWHTSDSGQTWAQQTVPEGASILRGLTFINSQTGWVVGTKYIGDDQYGHPQHIAAVYHTSNGGKTWLEQYTPQLEVSLTAAHFVDADHGWAVGFPTRSSVEGGFVFHTKNGGQTWERQEPGGFFAPLWDIHFIDAQRGYTIGADYTAAWGPPVWRTSDGGETWEKIRMKRHENDGLFGLDVTETRVIALGDHDYMVTSNNPWDPYPEPTGAELFEQEFINTHYRFEDVFFAGDEHGWAVGSRSFAPSITGQVIYHTQDGGTTWTRQYEHAPDLNSLFSYHRLDSVYFVDDQHGWAVGTSERFQGTGGWEYSGAILHTTDGGQTWQEQGAELYEEREREFFAVQFLDGQNGWALANKKFPSQNIYLAKTTNAGANWEWVDTGIEGPLAVGFLYVFGDVVFTDSQHGWAGGGLGKVIHTKDGGLTWNQQPLSCVQGYPSCPWAVFALDFVNNREGWLAGEAVYQTNDGGANWPERDVGTAGYFQDVQLFDDGTGWMVGEKGLVLYTSQVDRRWHQLPSGTYFSLRGLSFRDRTKGWMVGDRGTILHFTADRLPVEKELFFPLVTGG